MWQNCESVLQAVFIVIDVTKYEEQAKLAMDVNYIIIVSHNILSCCCTGFEFCHTACCMFQCIKHQT